MKVSIRSDALTWDGDLPDESVQEIVVIVGRVAFPDCYDPARIAERDARLRELGWPPPYVTASPGEEPKP